MTFLGQAGAAEERYRALIQAVPVGTYESGPDGDWLLVNKRWSELSGLEPYEAAGNGWAAAIHPDDRSRVLAAWHQLVEMGSEFSDFEYRFLRPDGTVVWVAANAVTIRDRYGEVTGFLGTAREITDRVELEAALKSKTTELERAHARLEDAQALAHVGSWGWDPAAGSFSWSAEQFRIHGLEPAAGAPNMEAFLSVVHPADRKRVRRELTSAVERLLGFENEYRVVWPSGEIHTIRARCRLSEVEGRPSLTGIAQDVTEQRALEAALLSSEALYRSLGANLPNASVLVFDRRLRYVRAMGAGRSTHGYDEGFFIGKHVTEVGCPEQKTMVRGHYPAALRGETRRFESQSSDGKAWFAIQVGPLRDGQGHIAGGIVVSFEITDRKHAEEKLEASYAELERSARAAAHDLQESLRVLTGFLELVERRYGDRLDLDGRHFVEAALAGARRMQKPIRGLLNASRSGRHL